jgi:HEAT repeat protein
MIACAHAKAGGDAVPHGREDGDVRLDDLLRDLRSPDDRTRENAACSLRDLVLGADDEARCRAVLRDALYDANATVRYYAVQGLGRVGDAAILEAVHDPGAPVRREAVALVGSLHDAERIVWAEGLAAEVDLALAPSDISLDAALQTLGAALTDPSFEVREAAFHALGAMGPRARTAVPALLTALEDADVAVRALAAEALGRIGTEARAALPLLRRMAADETQEDVARESAAAAVASIEGGGGE